MRMLWGLVGIALAGLEPGQARADDTELWTAIAVNGPIADGGKALLWFDGHVRLRDDGSRIATSIVRPGVGWRFNDRLDVWAGYGHITTHRDGANVPEHRFWQQASYNAGPLLGGALSLRTRLEQRFRDNSDDTGHRFRQFVRWSRPIEATPLSWVLSDEIFVNLNDTSWGQADGYGQNRAFAGLAWRGAQNLRLEAGYLHNHIDGGAAPDRTNHNVMLAVFLLL